MRFILIICILSVLYLIINTDNISFCSCYSHAVSADVQLYHKLPYIHIHIVLPHTCVFSFFCSTIVNSAIIIKKKKSSKWLKMLRFKYMSAS